MPYQVQSNYPAGASTTSASGGGSNPFLEALLARENQALLAQQAQRSGTMAASARPAAGRGGMGANNAGAQMRTDPGNYEQERREKQMHDLKMGEAQQALLMRSARPRDFGRMQANNIGDWGNYVNPADVPAALQDTIKGGFYSFGNAAGIAPLYPGMVKHGFNGSGASGGDNSIAAQQMGEQRASVQNTGLPGALEEARRVEDQKHELAMAQARGRR